MAAADLVRAAESIADKVARLTSPLELIVERASLLHDELVAFEHSIRGFVGRRFDGAAYPEAPVGAVDKRLMTSADGTQRAHTAAATPLMSWRAPPAISCAWRTLLWTLLAWVRVVRG